MEPLQSTSIIPVYLREKTRVAQSV